jgi:hypothetical protein
VGNKWYKWYGNGKLERDLVNFKVEMERFLFAFWLSGE